MAIDQKSYIAAKPLFASHMRMAFIGTMKNLTGSTSYFQIIYN